ncbi:MAG: L-2-amino-thiazoline-4-carboxylic acid hydrolase, partial [Candidatus Hodarchaeota archaeon]
LITDYVHNLTTKLQTLVEGDFSVKSPGKIKELFTNYKNLIQYPDLNKASLNYFIHLLRLKNQSAWETEVQISMRALIQAWTYPSYYFLQTLAETIGREKAVKLFKRYITQYYIDHPSPDRDKFVSLEKRLEDRLSGDTTSSDWVIVHTMLEDGKYAFKNENCPTCADAMVELPDVEFKYLAVCYGDYAKFRAYSNDHIILTMEHTIIEGDPYCSRVLHDTRIDYDLRHPPKEFWDNMKPGNEEEAKKYYKKYSSFS